MFRFVRSTLIILFGCVSFSLVARAQDSSGVETVARSFVWSSANAIAVNGNYIYIADGTNGLRIFSNTAGGYTDVGICSFQDDALDVKVVGNYAYVACTTGLRVINVANPHSPQVIGLYSTQEITRAVAVSGNYAYIANSASGVRVINISNPTSPTIVGTLQTVGSASRIAVSGNHVYVATDSYGMRIINVANPASPVEVGSFVPESIANMVVDGNYAYVNGNNTNNLRIVNISNPASPLEVGHWTLSGQYLSHFDSRAIGKSGNYLFAGAYIETQSLSNHYEGFDLCAVDVSNPTSPISVSSAITPTYPGSATISGNNVYSTFGAGGVYVDTLSANGSISSLKAVGFVSNIYTHRTAYPYVYVSYGTALFFLSLTNPAQPLFAGYYPLSESVYDIIRRGEYLYMIANVYLVGPGPTLQYGYFHIYNITNRLSPLSICRISTPYLSRNIAFSGIYAYVTTDSCLKVIDISTPANAQVVGTLTLSRANQIATSGNYAYVYADTNLYVVNVSAPSSPVIVGHCVLSEAPNNIVVSGQRAYITQNTIGIRIIDISNAAQPISIGTFSTSGTATTLTLAGDHGYLAAGSAGIRVLNFSSPDSLHEIGFYDTPGYAHYVDVVNDTVYVSDGTNFGIYDCSQALGIVDRIESIIPQQFSLKQNYPNPFNPTTTIEYTIPKTSKVSLKLFDITGREVGTLVNFNQNPGTYSVKLDASKLASGIYFYRLNAGSNSFTKKLSVIK